jgi:hypothetical protein
MTDHKAEQKITDELAKQPKDDDDTDAKEGSKQSGRRGPMIDPWRSEAA